MAFPGILESCNRSSLNNSILSCAVGRTISDGYLLPSQKQGINDQRYFQWSKINPARNISEADLRYMALQSTVAPSVRRYNLFWSSFETSRVAPSTEPLHCPAGTVQVHSHTMAM